MKRKMYIVSKTNFFYLVSSSFFIRKMHIKNKFIKYPTYDLSISKSHFASQYQELKKFFFMKRNILSDMNELILPPKAIQTIIQDIEAFSPDVILLESRSQQNYDTEIVRHFSANVPIYIYNKQGKNDYKEEITLVSTLEELSKIPTTTKKEEQ